MVVLLPYYETVDSVITFLHRHHNIDVAKYGRSGFLLITDAYKTYMRFQEDRDLFFKRLLSHAAMSDKNGISFFMDMGISSMVQDLEKHVVGYQKIIPDKQQFKIKAFFSQRWKMTSRAIVIIATNNKVFKPSELMKVLW